MRLSVNQLPMKARTRTRGVTKSACFTNSFLDGDVPAKSGLQSANAGEQGDEPLHDGVLRLVADRRGLLLLAGAARGAHRGRLGVPVERLDQAQHPAAHD